MTTLSATNPATSQSQDIHFSLDFDKKKLTGPALRAQARHSHLQTWFGHPIITAHFQARWKTLAPEAIYLLCWGDSKDSRASRLKAIQEALVNPGYFRETTLMETMHKGLRKNNAPARLLCRAGINPSPVQRTTADLDAFMAWRKSFRPQVISGVYQALITVYYLTLIQPMGAVQTAFNFVFLHQELKKIGFGVVADYILDFYAKNEIILADALASCFHAQGKKFHQQHWFQFFFEAWDWALEKLEREIQAFCFQSCFNAHALALSNNQTLNERQYQLLMFLQEENRVRDKKALSFSRWYRNLYQDLTKRTQERDFNLLCELGFIQMRGKVEFELVA